MGGILNLVTGNAGKKQAKKQAAATLLAADNVAKNDRVVAQGAQQAKETMLAQDVAAREAAESLSKPQGVADVSLANATPVDVDPTTGRRRSTRSTFTAATPTSGIRI